MSVSALGAAKFSDPGHEVGRWVFGVPTLSLTSLRSVVAVMRRQSRCRCCGRAFRRRPRNPTQQYCSQRRCQRAPKREWQRRERGEDPDYRANERAAQRAWARAHAQYWRRWRAAHPEYVQRNRLLQRGRNARRRAAAAGIANGDAWTRDSVLPPGRYRLEPWRCARDCKWDVSPTQISFGSRPWRMGTARRRGLQRGRVRQSPSAAVD